MHVDWAELPPAVRDAILSHTGPVNDVTPIRRGQSCDLAAVLHIAHRRVFVKGVRGARTPRMRRLRNETTQGELAAGLAPAVLFHVDTDDWLIVAFEYVDGRPASFAPGSPDLPLVAETLGRLSMCGAPEIRSLRERWAGGRWWHTLGGEHPEVLDEWAKSNLTRLTRWEQRAPELVDGTVLLHTDLHQQQFLITESSGVRVIDWSWPAVGAPWVDTAFLVIRLIGAGHTPEQAEKWAGTVPGWHTASEEALTAFAAYVSGLWRYRAITAPAPGGAARATTAQTYAAHRLS
ncbi:aminoglycoside phosphotransferase/kinase family protein [Streptoalloteichus hindustanus]|uniref:Ser/Thr protein kinase RdoA involved in Cpx stress response, MazF antagonist n=1 Tax=Streptoalloteichus hindustanus TaxID=2017 RepID=A0A1M5NAC5_STRHI|nr:hypothetical protein [Streptoalloteichus hindustanus]SHG86536.1 Ser/Thr protein kinase RdoA involved in Cpx stress response, MazF antagonist [Streptoalloteichus hindustanus]